MGNENKYHRRCSEGSKNAVANWLEDPQVGNSWHRSRDRGEEKKERQKRGRIQFTMGETAM